MKSSRSHEPSGSNAWAWRNSAEMHCVLTTSSCQNYNHKPVYKQQDWRCDSCLLFFFPPWFSVIEATESLGTPLGRVQGWGWGWGRWGVGGEGCLSVCPPNSIRTDGQTEQRTAALGNLRHQTSGRLRPRLAGFHINRSRLPAWFYSG